MNGRLLLALVFPAAWSAFSAPTHLSVERLADPCGVDASVPRLGWRLPEGTAGLGAYEIASGGRKTGKVVSSRQIDVPWPFAAPVSSERVTWRVRAWDGQGRDLGWSEPATFVAGIMDGRDWKAKWIAQDPSGRPDVIMGDARWIVGDEVVIPVRRTSTDDRADLVVAATSCFRVEVGGKAIYEPQGERFDRRYPVFVDLTRHLVQGTNDVKIAFAQDSIPRWEFPRTDSGVRAAIATVRFADGRRIGSAAAPGQEDLGTQREPVFARDIDWREEVRASAFARTFRVEKPVRRATLHVTGLGFYEASLNGRRIGDKMLDPPPTDYMKRVKYSTYVLDGQVRTGDNRIVVLLGHGWWDVRTHAPWNYERAPWRTFPKMIAQLELEHEDGSRSTVVSDGTWEQVANPVRWDCIYEGEVTGSVDGNAALPHAVEVAPPAGRLECAALPPARIVREVRPTEVRRLPGGEWSVRFPETAAGWVRMKVRGLARGDCVKIRYDENLDGRRLIDMFFFNSASYRLTGSEGAAQTDHYISSGAAEETYEPRFTYNGFRAVVVSGLKAPLSADDVTMCCVQTDFPEVGSFACSDGTLTTLVEMAKNSYRVNFADGYPTDCPHREKLGWTGDAWIASELGHSYFDNAAAYRKWLQDLIDTQRADGAICAIAPTSDWGFREYSGPVFDAALAAVPWNLYLYRGDRSAVDLAYPALKRYLAFERTQESAEGLVSNGLGDWNCPDRRKRPTTEYVASCAYLYILNLSAKMAKLRDEGEDASEFARRAQALRRAIGAKYDRGDGVFDNGGQTAQAIAVALDLAQDGASARAAERLADACSRPIEFGLVGAKVVYRALSKIGRDDLALRLIVRRERPSPGYWVGKTSTLWEDWGKGMSKAHVMLGDFAAWAMRSLAGLRFDAADRYVIRPSLGSGLSWARASTETPFGRLAVAWNRRTDGDVDLEATVPAGTTARVELPDGRVFEVAAGTHRFAGASCMTNGVNAGRSPGVRTSDGGL